LISNDLSTEERISIRFNYKAISLAARLKTCRNIVLAKQERKGEAAGAPVATSLGGEVREAFSSMPKAATIGLQEQLRIKHAARCTNHLQR
jgi:hypothetical protein